MQAKNPNRVGMLCSPLEPRLAKTRLNRVEQNKGSLRRPFPHRPEVFIARVWRRKTLEVRIICDRTGAYEQVCLCQLLQAGDKVPTPGYSIVSIRPSLSQAEELQAPKETLGRYCYTASIRPVLVIPVERPEHAIQGVIQPERVLTSGCDKDPSISLCNHPPRRRRGGLGV